MFLRTFYETDNGYCYRIVNHFGRTLTCGHFYKTPEGANEAGMEALRKLKAAA